MSIKKLIIRFWRRLVIPGMAFDISLEVFDGASQAKTHKETFVRQSEKETEIKDR